MTTFSRRMRWMAPPVAIVLAAGVLGALAAPASAAKTTFTQDTDIFLDDGSSLALNGASVTIPDFGKGTPYPSEITLTHAATITDLNVMLFDINHTYPDDVDIMLQGPDGKQVTLMSDAGTNLDLVNVDLTFDD